MIERLEGLPASVDGFKVSGEVSRADYEEVLVPWVKGLIEAEAEIRCVIEIGPDFEGYDKGAAWEDVKLGLGKGMRHPSLWKKVALVTEVRWIRQMSVVMGWMVPGELKLFDLDGMDAATAWAAG